MLDERGAEELLQLSAPHWTVGREALALHDDAAAVCGHRCDIHASVAGSAVHHDVRAAVAAEQHGDVVLELPPVHGVDGRHDSGVRARALGVLKVPQSVMVIAELLLDFLNVVPERDQFLAVLTGGLDEGVEHGDDGLAEDVGDAAVDAVVEGLRSPVDRVIHRLIPCHVFHVEQVCTCLTCGFAVPEEHGDVEDGAP